MPDKTLEAALDTLEQIRDAFPKASAAQQSRLNDRWNILVGLVSDATGYGPEEVTTAVLDRSVEKLITPTPRRAGEFKPVMTVVQIFQLEKQDSGLYLSPYDADTVIDQLAADGFRVFGVELHHDPNNDQIVRRTLSLVREDLAR